MSGIGLQKPKGLLRTGWSSVVEDYVITGGWSSDGAILTVGDATGGLYAFEGTLENHCGKSIDCTIKACFQWRFIPRMIF